MNREAFFKEVRATLFGGSLSAPQVEGLEAILDALYTYTIPLEDQAYILATAYHETARTIQPVRETKALTDDQAIARLENAYAAGKLPWVKTPYWRKDAQGKSWLGRGYVQLTHKYNYERATREIGVDFVSDPNRAMISKYAARILIEGSIEGWFTGKKLSDYKTYYDKRRVINGEESASLVATYAVKFHSALRVAGETPIPVPVPPVIIPVTPPQPPVQTVPEVPRVDVPVVVPNEPTSLLGLILETIAKLFGGKR